MWEKEDRQRNSEEALEETCTVTSGESVSRFYINSISAVCQAKGSIFLSKMWFTEELALQLILEEWA